MMNLEPTGEEQEKFRANFKLISSAFASLPIKIPGTAFYRAIKVSFSCSYINRIIKTIIQTPWKNMHPFSPGHTLILWIPTYSTMLDD